MHPTWKTELRALLKLSVPVITVQVGAMFMGFVDTMMVGHYDEADLAAAGLGNFYSMILMMSGGGVLLALDPVMSQAVGAKDDAAISRNLQRGFVLALVLALPTALAYMFVAPALELLRQLPDLIPKATTYVWTLIPGILPFYLFMILRTTLQAYHRTAPIVWSIILANLANVVLNWALIFGHLGCAEMGLHGSAVGTLICRWLLFAALLFAGRSEFFGHLFPWTRRAFDRIALRRLVRVGAPIGTQMFLEFSAFGVALVLMGWISVSALAGHQAAINLASLTYMFTVGVSVATGVRVGNGIGRGDTSGARWSAVMGLVVGAAIMVVFAAVFFAFPRPLASLFTESEDVGAFQVAVLLVPIAAVFQVVDGLQVVSLGALRGVADTLAPMLINLVGFWGIGMPCGYWFAFGLDGGPEGLWWGLTVGLTVVAGLLVFRVWIKLRGELTRAVIDDGDALDPA